jgi:hypothetical protein
MRALQATGIGKTLGHTPAAPASGAYRPTFTPQSLTRNLTVQFRPLTAAFLVYIFSFVKMCVWMQVRMLYAEQRWGSPDGARTERGKCARQKKQLG